MPSCHYSFSTFSPITKKMSSMLIFNSKLCIASLLLLLLSTSFFSSCKKSDVDNQPTENVNLNIEKFTTLPANANRNLKLIVGDLKKREIKRPFISNFIKNNGYPMWDQAISNIPLTNTLENLQVSFKESISSGVLFVPFRKEGSNKITTYLVIYKKNDTTYKYKYYNRAAIESFNTSSVEMRNTAINILSVFGYFERKINNVQSFSIPSPYNVTYKNIDLKISEHNNSSTSNKASLVLPDCVKSYVAEVTLVYPDGTTSTGTYTIYINDCYQDIDYLDGSGGDDGLGGSGSGGDGGTGGTGGGGTGDGGGGDGYYWDENCQCYSLDPWWDGSDPLTTINQQLVNILQPGEEFYISNSIDPNNALTFNSVTEFENYLNSNISFDNPTYNIIDDNTKLVTARINRTFVGGYDITVKLGKNTTSNRWEVKNVTSSEWGVVVGWGWSQTEFANETINSDIFVTVKGTENYYILIEGIGAAFKSPKTYKLKINNITGEMTGIYKL